MKEKKEVEMIKKKAEDKRKKKIEEDNKKEELFRLKFKEQYLL